MIARLLITFISGLLLVQGSSTVMESPPVIYPVITGVTITAPDGAEFDPFDLTVLDPGARYVFTAIVQRDIDWGDGSQISTVLPEGWELSWDSNFGTFDEQRSTENGVEWDAPDDPGDVIITATLDADVDDERVTYVKSFRIWVGEHVPSPDFAPDHILVMFQDWVEEEDVAAWARVRPATGEYRVVGRSINAYTLDIDEEIGVRDAAREITWWPCVRTAEPDFVLDLMFDSDTGSWDFPSPVPVGE